MKKIAFFIGQLFAEYQIDVTKALEAEAAKRGYRLDVFINFGIYGGNFLYAEGEKSIRFIPDLNEYDGIIMASDTYELPGFDEELGIYIRKNFKKPIISLRQEDKDAYSIMIDDKLSIRMILEHFIKHHGFTRICFMTGKMEMEDAQRRLEAYKEVMAENNIPVNEHMIYYGNYWRDHGERAVDWFYDQPEAPQAIVCSNDYMAISVCDALKAKGIRIPQDVSVSGFDDVEEARFYIPPITSLHVPSDTIGQTAVDLLCRMEQGEVIDKKQLVPVHMNLRASCGCESELDMSSVQVLLAQKVKLENTLSYLAYMNVSFEHADSLDSLLTTANFYCRYLPFKKIFLCMCDEEEMANRGTDVTNPYPDHMVLKAILGGGEVEWKNEKFLRTELVPEQYREDINSLYIVTLHDKSDNFGYVAMVAENIDTTHHAFQIWLLSLADALGKLKMYNDSQELTDLREKYEIDALTGIGNRRKLEHVVRVRHERMTTGTGDSFTIMSVDMDDLKIINDSFGHQAGDDALSLLAHILSDNCGELGEAMRTGGDEFQVCLDTKDDAVVQDYIARVRKDIQAVTDSGEYAFSLSASIGYAICRREKPLMESMKLADDRMYQEKREKKRRRREGN